MSGQSVAEPIKYQQCSTFNGFFFYLPIITLSTVQILENQIVTETWST